MLARMQRNCISHTLLVGFKMIQPLWKIVHHLMKLNMQLSFDPEITFLGIYPREVKTYVHRNTCIQMFIAVSLETTPMSFSK